MTGCCCSHVLAKIQELLHHLWSPVQNENVGVLCSRLGGLSRQQQQMVTPVQALGSAGPRGTTWTTHT